MLRQCIIEIFSGITSGRVLHGKLLDTEILEATLFALPTDCFMRISLQVMRHLVNWKEIFMKQSEGKCK